MALDLGASWIHGASKNNPLVDLAKRAGASTAASTDSGRIHWASGTELSAAEERMDALLVMMEQGVARLQNSNKDASLLVSARSAVRYAQLSERDKQLADFLINSYYEQEYSGPPRI